MKCNGKFTYRGYKKVEAGSFIDEHGVKRDYNASYKVKVDETTIEGLQERIFKVDIDSPTVADLIVLKPYDVINIEFEVQLYTTGCRLIPVAIKPLSK